MFLQFLITVLLIHSAKPIDISSAIESLDPLVQAFGNTVINQLESWRPIDYIFNVTMSVEYATQRYYDYGYAKSSAVGYPDPDFAGRILRDAIQSTFGRMTPLRFAQANSLGPAQLLLDANVLNEDNLYSLASAYAEAIRSAVEKYPYVNHLAAIENSFIVFAFPRGFYTKESVIRGHLTFSKFLHFVVGDIEEV